MTDIPRPIEGESKQDLQESRQPRKLSFYDDLLRLIEQWLWVVAEGRRWRDSGVAANVPDDDIGIYALNFDREAYFAALADNLAGTPAADEFGVSGPDRDRSRRQWKRARARLIFGLQLSTEDLVGSIFSAVTVYGHEDERSKLAELGIVRAYRGEQRWPMGKQVLYELFFVWDILQSCASENASVNDQAPAKDDACDVDLAPPVVGKWLGRAIAKHSVPYSELLGEFSGERLATISDYVHGKYLPRKTSPRRESILAYIERHCPGAREKMELESRALGASAKAGTTQSAARKTVSAPQIRVTQP